MIFVPRHPSCIDVTPQWRRMMSRPRSMNLQGIDISANHYLKDRHRNDGVVLNAIRPVKARTRP